MSGIPAGAGSLLGKRLGKYEILALLALGGTAEIYLARIGGAAGFEKYVVVKCLHDHLADDAEFVKMFLDEARLAAHLDHSNIVQTMELGEHENRYYMVMEFLAGLSLAMVVRRASERLPGGRIPVPLVMNMIAQSCAGLHYAHERVVNGKALNIVHRDISPQNLVVSFEGVVKLVDFGIAKAELRETRTQSGTIKGKFAYMSPEQCVANNVDRRTDVFALGVIAHELLTGRRLFKKPSAYETYQAVIECAVEPPSRLSPDIDPAIDAVIMRAVDKDKERRYPTAEAFGDAILGYLHHRGKGSGPGDVARFFDTAFAQEIEEHGARMRELIAGRAAAEGTASWGGDEDDKIMVEVSAKEDRSVMLAASDLEEIADPNAASSLSEVIGELEVPSATGEAMGDDLPAERTRIEANPLERLNELEAELAKSRGGAAAGAVSAASKPAQRPSTGRFADLPTVIADPDPGAAAMAAAGFAPELAKTELGAQPIGVDANARTALDMSAPSAEQIAARAAAAGTMPPPQRNGPAGAMPRPGAPFTPAMNGPGGPPPGLPPGLMPPNGMPPNGMPPVQAQGSQPIPPPLGPHAGPGPHGPYPGGPMGPNGPMGPGGPLGPPQPGRGPMGPAGYPVMNAQMREQMASGATVFPSDLGSGPHDGARAVDMASPIGGPMAHHDWSAAAAAPARAMPPWKLAVIFVGALGGALLITVLIALAAR